jgi:hypothetical protein
MFLLYPLCLLPAALLALILAFVDAGTNLGALGLFTWRHPTDLAIVAVFSVGAVAITNNVVRRAERRRALLQPYWRRHINYCIALYLLALVCAPSLACGAARRCVGPDDALPFIAGLCALAACAIQALALASVRRHARLPHGSITPLQASTI